MALICLVFFGVFELSQLFASKEVLDYAASRGLRAKTVGFNDFMVFKTIRVGAIPTAGRLINPGYADGPASEYATEAGRIPLYLGADNYGQLPAILDYEHWDTASDIQYNDPVTEIDGSMHLRVVQNVSLTNYPFNGSLYDADYLPLAGEGRIEKHYDLYLQETL